MDKEQAQMLIDHIKEIKYIFIFLSAFIMGYICVKDVKLNNDFVIRATYTSLKTICIIWIIFLLLLSK